MHKALLSCIEERIHLPAKTQEAIQECFHPRSLRNGEYLVEAGERCRELAFVQEGVLRTYNLAEGEEVTLWLASEKKFATSVSSFVFGTQSRWHVQAVTDCELLLISREDHFQLLEEHPAWMEFDNLALANAYAFLEDRMFAHLYTTARERYQELMEKDPELFNRVPLQYIASMLGVRPETLSRLRSEANS